MNNFLKDLDNQTPTFCATPFVSMMVNTDTTIRYCCMVKGALNKVKKPDGTPYHIRDNFSEAWNSKDMRDIRMAMVSGQHVEGCSTCYLQEASGRISNRQYSNQEWTNRLGKDSIKKTIDEAIVNNGMLKYNVAYLDLRLGNLCNLKCRMCNPYNSSQIAKEHIELDQTDPKYKAVWAKTFGKFNIKIMEVQEWFDQDILWGQVIDLIPSLHKVYMTGGEPTLISNNFRFMEACIEQGRTDIVLFFNTNCTNINKRFLELIKQFETVYVNASVDGTGIVNEYIRTPSKWTQIKENVETLSKMPNVVLGITPTVQVYNIFNLTDMLDWAQSLDNVFVDFLINVHPFHLAVNILPDDIRHGVAKKLQEYVDKFPPSTPAHTKNSTVGIIGLLQQPRNEDWLEQLQRLKDYTLSLDRARSQDINQLDSRLAEIINAV
jgi:MoaA/NifB/PqqE/SkfB family radical SAM enzyme